MSSNQRENERKARKNAKTKKKMKLLWILIAAIAAVIVVLKVCEVDFSKLFRFSNGSPAIRSRCWWILFIPRIRITFRDSFSKSIVLCISLTVSLFVDCTPISSWISPGRIFSIRVSSSSFKRSADISK